MLVIVKNAEALPAGHKPAPGELVFVQGFVNTADLEAGSDALATPAEAAAWLVRHGLLEPGARVSEAERRRLVAFRDALRAVLLAHGGQPLDAAAVATLQEVAGELPLRLRYAADGSAGLEPAADGVAGALGRLQAVIYRAMLEGTWERLKACGNDECQWVFYDASRNRSGTWCTMEVCGNRMKVRAHRRRHAEEGGEGGEPGG